MPRRKAVYSEPVSIKQENLETPETIEENDNQRIEVNVMPVIDLCESSQELKVDILSPVSSVSLTPVIIELSDTSYSPSPPRLEKVTICLSPPGKHITRKLSRIASRENAPLSEEMQQKKKRKLMKEELLITSLKKTVKDIPKELKPGPSKSVEPLKQPNDDMIDIEAVLKADSIMRNTKRSRSPDGCLPKSKKGTKQKLIKESPKKPSPKKTVENTPKNPKQGPSNAHLFKPPEQSLPKAAPVILPTSSDVVMSKPKFNIVHADKEAKLAAESAKRNAKRSRSPSPLKFDLVLRNSNVPRPRGRPRAPNKKKEERKDEYCQHFNGKIDRTKDYHCEGCLKSLIHITSSQDPENLVLNLCLESLRSTSKQLAIEPKKNNGVVHQMQTSRKVTTIHHRKNVPDHKVPTIKPKEMSSAVPKDAPKDTNIEHMDMDIEPTPEPTMPKVTMTWDKESPSFNRSTEYGPYDFINDTHIKPSYIPQGSIKSKRIFKKDDKNRIGQFVELYDNPWRSKLLEVEHPPEEPTEKSSSNMMFSDEIEPEHLTIEPEEELNNIFNDLSDEEGGDNPQFSDDEDDQMSDTCSVAPVEALDNPHDFMVNDVLKGMDENECFDEFLKMHEMIEVETAKETPQVERPPTSQEPHPVAPAKRIEAEMTKNLTKTPLEMVDDELDYDEEVNDIESPAYEAENLGNSELLHIMSVIPPVVNESPTATVQNEAKIEVTKENIEESPKTFDLNCPTVETPGILPLDNAIVSPAKFPDTGPLRRPTPALISFAVLSQTTDIESLETTLKTCTDEFLIKFYEHCVMNFNECFKSNRVSLFPILIREMGVRHMSDQIMKAFRFCETRITNFTHYKCVIDNLIMTGFHKHATLHFILDNYALKSDATTDQLIEIILEHDCADNMIEYLEKFAMQKTYTFKYSSLERLITQAFTKMGNSRWKNLINTILKNEESKETLSQNAELAKQTMEWLNKDCEDKTPEIVDQKETSPEKPGIFSWFKRTVTNNHFSKNQSTRPMPDLVRIHTRK